MNQGTFLNYDLMRHIRANQKVSFSHNSLPCILLIILLFSPPLTQNTPPSIYSVFHHKKRAYKIPFHLNYTSQCSFLLLIEVKRTENNNTKNERKVGVKIFYKLKDMSL